MDQQASLAVSVMLDAFGAKGDPDVLIRTYAAILRDVSSQAVVDTAERFTAGKVDGQRLRYAPTPAEFAAEARKQHDANAIASRPRLPRPEYERSGPRPFEVRQTAALARFADHPVLHKDVTHEKARALSEAKLLPTGAVYVACLGTVYGPKPKSA